MRDRWAILLSRPTNMAFDPLNPEMMYGESGEVINDCCASRRASGCGQEVGELGNRNHRGDAENAEKIRVHESIER